jgi:hypothetical protein
VLRSRLWDTGQRIFTSVLGMGAREGGLGRGMESKDANPGHEVKDG